MATWHEFDRRLDSYFAALRKRSTANWQVYAAVTGSAMAMATGASASVIAGEFPEFAAEPVASARSIRPNPASSQNMLIVNAVRSAARFPNAKMAQSIPAAAPTISAGGIVPLYSASNTIQPGEWISIFGSNLASASALWNGDFPTSLAGTSVEINGKAAYLMYVSPGQINLQTPDDTATGSVSVVVNTAAGSATSSVTLSQFAPSFVLESSPGFVSAIILRSNGSGAYGGGAYDILGPTGSYFGYRTVAAKPGDIVELYAVGLGPTTPTVAAGKPFNGSAPVNNAVTLYINNVAVKPSYAGISSAGLYQINLTVPHGLGVGQVPLQAMVGGVSTQANVWFTLAGGAGPSGGGTAGSAGVSGGGQFFSSGPVMTGGTMGPTGGGTDAGTGGAGSNNSRKKRWEPKLRFPPK